MCRTACARLCLCSVITIDYLAFVFVLQIVVIIGMGSSAQDISKEISHVAKEIHLASRSTDVIIGKLDGHDNIWQHSMVNNHPGVLIIIFYSPASSHAA